MPEKGPALPSRRAPNQDGITRAGMESSETAAGSWSLFAKIGTGAFGTVIAPILVALFLKLLDSPAPPAVQPAIGHAEPKIAAEVAVPISSSTGSAAATPKAPVARSAPTAGSSALVSKPDLASNSTAAPHKTKKKKSVAQGAGPSKASAGFTSLFNGRDLSGWTGGDKRWSVDQRAQLLVGHDLTGTKGNLHSWLYTEHNFTDFRLRLEFRALPGTDSGIALRTSPGAILDERFEIQLLGDQDHVITTGTIIGLRKDKAHPHTRPTTPVSLRPAGDWNLVEVDLRGPRLRLTINGQAVQDVRFDERPVLSKSGTRVMGDSGRIALQGRTGHVEFRKIEIQELTRSTR
jgi:3-keto-disaccharide hydrolase